MIWRKIEYGENAGRIEFPTGAPFDGKPVLIRTNTGVVEAWWKKGGWSEDPQYPLYDFSGFVWVCYGDKFQEELDDATHWMPLPADPEI